jgi:hypothetical protein
MCFRLNEAGTGKAAQAAQVDHHFISPVDAADITRQHSRIGCVLDVADQCHADVPQGVIAELPQQQDVSMPSADEYQLAKAGEV